MKSNILTTVLIFILTSILVCQQTPDIDLPLTVSDNLGNSKELRYGLDPLATDGIDTELGEITLPPNPPTGVFDVRFRVANLESSWKDYRNGTFNFVGEKTDTIYYMAASGFSILTFEWNMPEGVTGLLQDMFGGILVDENMSGIGSFNLTNLFLNPLKMIIYYDHPLPVELCLFTATLLNNDVILNWKTQTEVNNFGFDVERKTDGCWEKLGFVGGQGNCNSPKEYSYIDKNPIGGNKFLYRLKQIDNDGQFEYSDVVEVNLIPAVFALYQNYPNPFNPSTKIKYQLPKACKVQIKIYDLLGAEVQELLNESKEPGIYEIEFNAENLLSGIYVYRISADNYLQTKKMILLK